MDELGDKLAPYAPAHFREGTWDRKIFALAASGIEYGNIYCYGGVVLDVGAHIGGFTTYAMRAGARRVVALEPWRDSFKLLRENVAPLQGVDGSVVTLIHGAIWTEDGKVAFDAPQAEPWNTGGGTANPTHIGRGEEVDAYALDSWLRELGHVDVLKMDCEGAELPVLTAARELARVDLIVGEYHRQRDDDLTPECMLGMLAVQGFAVAADAKTPHLGAFRARRTGGVE